MEITPPAHEVDLHRLDLRFADTRLLEPRALLALARSIAQCGQLIACIVVPEGGGERLVLVDGYRRISALRQLGRDTACVEAWAFAHYASSPQAARERMVTHPRLFVDALCARDEQRAATRLREGPEGQCATEVRQLLALSQRLRRGLATLDPCALCVDLLSALKRLRGALAALQSELARTLA